MDAASNQLMETSNHTTEDMMANLDATKRSQPSSAMVTDAS